MARGKKHTAEQIVNLLRQVEVSVANGKTLLQACKEVEIVEQTYYRWRKEYGKCICHFRGESRHLRCRE